MCLISVECTLVVKNASFTFEKQIPIPVIELAATAAEAQERIDKARVGYAWSLLTKKEVQGFPACQFGKHNTRNTLHSAVRSLGRGLAIDCRRNDEETVIRVGLSGRDVDFSQLEKKVMPGKVPKVIPWRPGRMPKKMDVFGGQHRCDALAEYVASIPALSRAANAELEEVQAEIAGETLGEDELAAAQGKEEGLKKLVARYEADSKYHTFWLFEIYDIGEFFRAGRQVWAG